MKTKLRLYPWPEFLFDVYEQIIPMLKPHVHKYSSIWGPPTGALSIAQILHNHLRLPYYPFPPADRSVLIADDTTDTGKTLSHFPFNDSITIFYCKKSVIKPTYWLHEQGEDEWILFPPEDPENTDDMPETIRKLITPEIITQWKKFAKPA